MIVVPAGHFKMGSPASEEGRFNDESPRHEVTIGKAFAVGRFAVTRGEFATFANETNHRTDGGCYAWTGSEWQQQTDKSWRSPGFAQDDRHPVVRVNWDDAKAYTAWLSKNTARAYRLLSEAEREYAARGGTTTRYGFGNDAKSICHFGNGADQTAKKRIPGVDKWSIADCDDGYAYPAPVGQFAANPFAIHDVHGNAWDWTEDFWHENYEEAPTDGSAGKSGDCSRRVGRGGSWGSNPRSLRSAYRHGRNTDLRGDTQGFRVARR